MKRIIMVATLTAICLVLLAQSSYCDDISDFQKKARDQLKKLEALRKAFVEITKRSNDMLSTLQEIETKDPNWRFNSDYRNKRNEYAVIQKKRREILNSLSTTKAQLRRTVISFLSANNREVVEAAFKVFYKGSSYPDVAAEEALLAGLKRVTDKGAIKFMLHELKNSRRKNVRKMICEAIAHRTQDNVVAALIETLSDKNGEVVAAASRALAKNRSKRAVEPMIEAFERATAKKNQGANRGLRQALQEMTGQYMLETAQDFRNWWNGVGKTNYNETETHRPRGLIDKDGPRSTLYGEITSKKVIFVCDVSGSMSARGQVPGEPIDRMGEVEKAPETGGDVIGGRRAKAEKKKFRLGKQGVKPGYVGMRIDILKIELTHVVMTMIPDGARFNLITYATEVQKWKNSLAKASKSNRRAAVEYVKKMKPSGNTNTYGALETAFSDKAVDTIYFLSDGNPTTGTTINHDEILRAVRRWNESRNVIINTIGLLVGRYGNEDQSKLKKFLQNLASQNGGECRIFENR